MAMTWELALAGLLTGLLVGMTGMGGGSLMTPILVFLFGISPATAIGTDIAHGAVFKTVGAVQHRRMGNVRASSRAGCSWARCRCHSSACGSLPG